jgi:hypothetical protein
MEARRIPSVVHGRGVPLRHRRRGRAIRRGRGAPIRCWGQEADAGGVQVAVAVADAALGHAALQERVVVAEEGGGPRLQVREGGGVEGTADVGGAAREIALDGVAHGAGAAEAADARASVR